MLSSLRLAGLRIALGGVLISVCAAALGGEARYAIEGADAARGAAALQQRGCAACHVVPGISGARGNVGPPLTRFADRSYIAGMLDNTPGNLVRWLRHPQSVVPGNAMPDMGIGEAEARDIAAYLYTLR